MRAASNDAIAAFFGGFVPVDVSLEVLVDPVEFDIVTIPSSRIVLDSMKISYLASTTDNCVFGSVIAPDLTVEVTNDNGSYDRINFVGLEIRVYAEFNVTGSSESVLMGCFICDSATKNGNNIIIRALGKITKMDKLYQTGDISFPITAWNLAVALCNECGLSVKAYESQDRVQNMYMVISAEPPGGKYTYRQLLGYVCEIMASCVHTRLVGGSEVVVIRWYTTESGTIGSDITFSSDFNKEGSGGLSGCEVTGKNGTASVGTISGSCYTVKNNPIVDGLTLNQMQSVAGAIFANGAYEGTSYNFRPNRAHLTILPNPLIEPLDGAPYSENGVIYGEVFFGGVTWYPQKNTELICVDFPNRESDEGSPFTPEQASIVGDVQNGVNDVSVCFVTETGSNNNGWHWRKWSDNTIEMWAPSLRVTLGEPNAWTSELIYMNGTITYPFALSSAAESQVDLNVTAHADVTEINGILLVAKKSTTDSIIRFVRKTSALYVYLDVYVRGTPAATQ